jgi:hypothetical protein
MFAETRFAETCLAESCSAETLRRFGYRFAETATVLLQHIILLRLQWLGGRQACIMGSDLVEGVTSVGQPFDGAKGARRCRVLHGAPTLAILLVVNIQPDIICLAEHRQQWHAVRDNLNRCICRS